MGLSMIMPIRSGSIVALVTPMTPTNGIDYATLETLLKWHVAEGENQHLSSLWLPVPISSLSKLLTHSLNLTHFLI